MDPKTPTTYRGLPPTLRTPSFGLPASPHRYSSGSSLNSTEEPLILEIGTRLLRAGFTNEAAPRCQLAWSEALWRRVGDKVTSTPAVGKQRGGRGVWDLGFALHGAGDDERARAQLGLVEDMVERGLRVAYNKHLLIDSKTRKVLLPVPPLFPTRLLTTLLATLFTHFQCPAITLMSSPILAVIASGLRSGLVVDIGWTETIITPVYELHPIEGRGVGVHGRSRRAIRELRSQWSAFLSSHVPDVDLDIDEVEEIMERIGHASYPADNSNDTDPEILIPVAGRTLRLPFSALAVPAERTFFAPSTTPSHSPAFADDDDTPLPMLLYNVLLRSAIDVRAACISRIIFVGGGSKIPGLPVKVLAELRGIVKERGWILGRRRQQGTTSATTSITGNPPQQVEPRVLEDVQEEEKETPPSDHADKENTGKIPTEKQPRTYGEVRGVRSLGVWCGASLVAGVKVRGKAEVERERFLSQVSMGVTGLPAGW